MSSRVHRALVAVYAWLEAYCRREELRRALALDDALPRSRRK